MLLYFNITLGDYGGCELQPATGCPPGLDCLLSINQLFIKQDVEMLEGECLISGHINRFKCPTYKKLGKIVYEYFTRVS